jgi:membrane-associated phospholipid phosphatase
MRHFECLRFKKLPFNWYKTIVFGLSLRFILYMKNFLVLCLLLPIQFIHPQTADIRILRTINIGRDTRLDPSFKLFTNSAAPVAVGVPVLIFGAGLIKKDTLDVNKSIYIGASVISAVVITSILKYSIDRPRPFDTYPDIEKATRAGSPSFPSGHTSDAFSLATSLSIAYPKWYIIVPGYAWALTVAYSRMHLGVHYPSDVLAGALIGAGSAYLCYKGQQWLTRKRNIVKKGF